MPLGTQGEPTLTPKFPRLPFALELWHWGGWALAQRDGGRFVFWNTADGFTGKCPPGALVSRVSVMMQNRLTLAL